MVNKKVVIFILFLFLGLTAFSQGVNAGSIAVATPGTLTPGTVYNITWTAWTTSGTNGPYAIWLCWGGSGSTCENIQSINSNVTGESYSWSVPTSLSTRNDYRIRIYNSGDVDLATAVGISGVFTITNSTTLAAPTLISPSNGAMVNSLTPQFQWSTSSGAGVYVWEIMYVDSNILTTNQVIAGSGKLSWGQTYTWRVRACTDSSINNCGDWSSQWTFTTQASASSSPVITISANPTQVSSGSLTTLNWSTSNTTSCIASSSPANSQWDGTKTISNSQSISNLTATTLFSLTCTGAGGPNSQSVTVTVGSFSSTSCTSSTTCPTGTSCINGLCSSTSTTNCDASSFLSAASVFDFQSGGSKTNLCGANQYFKITISSNGTCDLKWTLQSDANSDYDLYIKNDSSLTRNIYDSRSTEGKGVKDEIIKTGLSAGTYYALVYKESGTGSYSITATQTNCLGSTTTTTTTPTTTTTTTTTNNTTTDAKIVQLQTQINQLLAQISQLQSDLAKMQNTVGQPSATTSGSNGCYTFTSNLKYKDSGYAVGSLQAILQRDGLYSGVISGYFGTRTASAVSSFQEKYKNEILAPLNLVSGTGFVGTSTITKLNQLYGCK